MLLYPTLKKYEKGSGASFRIREILYRHNLDLPKISVCWVLGTASKHARMLIFCSYALLASINTLINIVTLW